MPVPHPHDLAQTPAVEIGVERNRRRRLSVGGNCEKKNDE
jgi:hypothetical protein